MVTRGQPDAFSGMGPQPGSADISHADLADGAWMAEPEQRGAYRAWLRRGAHWQAALTAVRLPAYARHLNAGWEEPLSPGAFLAAIHDAKAKRIPLDDVLRRMGYRSEYRDSPPEDPDAARKRAIADRKRVWAAQDAEWGVDVDSGESATGPPVARPASRAVSRVSGAARAAWMATTGIAGRPSNPNRRSQTPIGRRERYLRAIAERDGLTIEEAALLHPTRKVPTP